jgi:hypothetical protein
VVTWCCIIRHVIWLSSFLYVTLTRTCRLSSRHATDGMYPAMIDADQEKHGANTDEVIFSMVKRGFANETKDGYGAHFPRAIPCSPSAKDLISKLLTLDIAVCELHCSSLLFTNYSS